jgi:hypothetical protein
MSQPNYTSNLARGFEGQVADLRNFTSESRRALEKIPFGRALARGQAKPGQDVRLPMVNSVVLTASVDLVASNATTGSVTVTTIDANGDRQSVTTALTATAFATDHATTLAAIATKIDAVSGVASAVAAGDAITVKAENDTEVILSGFQTTGGAGQPTWTTAESTTDAFAGVSLHGHHIEQDNTTGIAQYLKGRTVDVLVDGAVNVKTEQATVPGDNIYARYKVGAAGTLVGNFRKDADSAKAFQLTRARWTEALNAGDIGPLHISLP